MKRKFIGICAVMLALALLLALVPACGDGDGEDEEWEMPEATPTAEVTPTEEATPTAEATPTEEATPTAEATPTEEATPTPSDYLTYTNEDVGFAIEHPADLPLSDEMMPEDISLAGIPVKGVAGFGSPEAFVQVSNVTASFWIPASGLFEAAYSFGLYSTQFPNNGIVSVSDEIISVSGSDGLLHVFTSSEGGIDLKHMRLYWAWQVPDGAEALIVDCVATEATYGSWEATFDHIIHSVTLL